MARLFRTSNPLPNVAPNWNVAPTQRVAAVRHHPQTTTPLLLPAWMGWPLVKIKNRLPEQKKSLDNLYFPYNIDLVEPKLQGSASMPSVSVTSADFQKNFGRYRETAIREPVTITNHGRDSLVLLSADEYRRLKSRDREVLLASELSEADLEAMLSAEIPEEAAAFDYELES